MFDACENLTIPPTCQTDMIEIRKAGDQGGSTRVTIPSDMADKIGVEPGDKVAFVGDGDGGVRLVTPDRLVVDDD